MTQRIVFLANSLRNRQAANRQTKTGIKSASLLRLLFFFFLLFFWACAKKPHAPTVRAYYYWQQNFDLSALQTQQLTDSLHVTKLYIKYFDVVNGNVVNDGVPNKPKPVADLTIQTPIPTAITEIVPTVFVRNEVLVHADSAAVDTLAAHISRKIRLKTTRYNLDTRVREWQIDCDWSVGTKEAYFRLLRKLKESNSQVRLSATIRLHQLKYAKQTGVPPVDRGMLMLYNMSDVAKPQTRNSILDIAVTRQYITAKTTYALPLDMALPAFAWGVVLQGAKVVGLQNNWTAKYCEKCSFLQKNKTGKYICTRDTVIGERYWRRGDAVRLEEATLADIQTLATLTTALRKADTTAVALFGWHEAMYAHYGKNDLISRWEAF